MFAISAESVLVRHLHVTSRPVKIARMIRGRSREAAALECLHQLWQAGKYEEVEAEAGARAFEAESGRLRKRGRGLAVAWHAKALATAASCAHGRGAQVLEELECLSLRFILAVNPACRNEGFPGQQRRPPLTLWNVE